MRKLRAKMSKMSLMASFLSYMVITSVIGMS
jgi:hypothetical protein